MWVPSLGWKNSPEEGHGNPLQYSCLENPTDRGAWRDGVHRVAHSWTRMKQLSTQACVPSLLAVLYNDNHGLKRPTDMEAGNMGTKTDFAICQLWDPKRPLKPPGSSFQPQIKNNK